MMKEGISGIDEGGGTHRGQGGSSLLTERDSAFELVLGHA